MRELGRCGCGRHMHNAGYVDGINQGNKILPSGSTGDGVRSGRSISCWSGTVFPTWGGPSMTGGQTPGRSRQTKRRGSLRGR